MFVSLFLVIHLLNKVYEPFRFTWIFEFESNSESKMNLIHINRQTNRCEKEQT